MGGPKGPMRGRKTHYMDIQLNRGKPREPEPREDVRAADADERPSKHEEQLKEEHPTRKTQAGYKSVGGHRR